MKFSFHGADRSVTGSCHLIEYAGRRIAVDCGRYQGSRELYDENADNFGFLSKRCFRGKFITTDSHCHSLNYIN